MFLFVFDCFVGLPPPAKCRISIKVSNEINNGFHLFSFFKNILLKQNCGIQKNKPNVNCLWHPSKLKLSPASPPTPRTKRSKTSSQVHSEHRAVTVSSWLCALALQCSLKRWARKGAGAAGSGSQQYAASQASRWIQTLLFGTAL